MFFLHLCYLLNWLQISASLPASSRLRFCCSRSDKQVSYFQFAKKLQTYKFPCTSSQKGEPKPGNYCSVDENTPLQVDRSHPQSGHKKKGRFLLFVFLVLFSGLCGTWIQESRCNNILHPKVRDRIRHEWNIELQNYNEAIERAQVEEQEWYEKKQRREREEAEWIRKARLAREAEEVEERGRQENKRKWERMEAERVGQVKSERMAEEREWQRMKKKREREEAEWVEKARKRERMRLYWVDVRGDRHCMAHGTRKYTARLANLLPGIDPIEACKATPFTIHGVTYDSPVHCEDHVSTILISKQRTVYMY